MELDKKLKTNYGSKVEYLELSPNFTDMVYVLSGGDRFMILINDLDDESKEKLKKLTHEHA